MQALGKFILIMRRACELICCLNLDQGLLECNPGSLIALAANCVQGLVVLILFART